MYKYGYFDLDVVNISLDVASLLFCALGIIISISAIRINKKTNILFSITFSMHFLTVLCNMLGIIFRGNGTLLGRVIVSITNFGEFMFTAFFGLMISYYFIKGKNGNTSMRNKILISIFPIMCIVLLIINIPTGIIYYVDSQNIYQRSNLYILMMISTFGWIFMDIVLGIFKYKEYKKTKKIAFYLFIIISLISVLLQSVSYGVYYILIATTVYLIIIFCITLYDMIVQYQEKREELFEIQKKAVLSQIQPHFLYNSLTAIMAVCDEPKVAKKAIADFSKYLRGNLDSLKYSKPIPFESELYHVKTYVRLEKLRFEDALTVEYNIETTEFNIPALTVQMLVENAIKHGITSQKDSGKVIISTRETYDDYIVTIQDDGVGFDIEGKITDERSHIGINNTRERLKSMCNGELHIESTISVGTIATVIIPK